MFADKRFIVGKNIAHGDDAAQSVALLLVFRNQFAVTGDNLPEREPPGAGGVTLRNNNWSWLCCVSDCRTPEARLLGLGLIGASVFREQHILVQVIFEVFCFDYVFG